MGIIKVWLVLYKIQTLFDELFFFWDKKTFTLKVSAKKILLLKK